MEEQGRGAGSRWTDAGPSMLLILLLRRSTVGGLKLALEQTSRAAGVGRSMRLQGPAAGAAPRAGCRGTCQQRQRQRQRQPTPGPCLQHYRPCWCRPRCLPWPPPAGWPQRRRCLSLAATARPCSGSCSGCGRQAGRRWSGAAGQAGMQQTTREAASTQCPLPSRASRTGGSLASCLQTRATLHA